MQLDHTGVRASDLGEITKERTFSVNANQMFCLLCLSIQCQVGEILRFQILAAVRCKYVDYMHWILRRARELDQLIVQGSHFSRWEYIEPYNPHRRQRRPSADPYVSAPSLNVNGTRHMPTQTVLPGDDIGSHFSFPCFNEEEFEPEDLDVSEHDSSHPSSEQADRSHLESDSVQDTVAEDTNASEAEDIELVSVQDIYAEVECSSSGGALQEAAGPNVSEVVDEMAHGYDERERVSVDSSAEDVEMLEDDASSVEYDFSWPLDAYNASYVDEDENFDVDLDDDHLHDQSADMTDLLHSVPLATSSDVESDGEDEDSDGDRDFLYFSETNNGVDGGTSLHDGRDEREDSRCLDAASCGSAAPEREDASTQTDPEPDEFTDFFV